MATTTIDGVKLTAKQIHALKKAAAIGDARYTAHVSRAIAMALQAKGLVHVLVERGTRDGEYPVVPTSLGRTIAAKLPSEKK